MRCIIVFARMLPCNVPRQQSMGVSAAGVRDALLGLHAWQRREEGTPPGPASLAEQLAARRARAAAAVPREGPRAKAAREAAEAIAGMEQERGAQLRKALGLVLRLEAALAQCRTQQARDALLHSSSFIARGTLPRTHGRLRAPALLRCCMAQAHLAWSGACSPAMHVLIKLLDCEWLGCCFHAHGSPESPTSYNRQWTGKMAGRVLRAWRSQWRQLRSSCCAQRGRSHGCRPALRACGAPCLQRCALLLCILPCMLQNIDGLQVTQPWRSEGYQLRLYKTLRPSLGSELVP